MSKMDYKLEDGNHTKVDSIDKGLSVIADSISDRLEGLDALI